ncbi:hypothetical protein AAGW05_11125 [Arthrobacter sp. LAPM80]|uniref:hypothetical protein n=1 Tax=Arthrobacter sp. LAPM80 TaxID=3141788 RepID=UPI00398A59BE
MNRTGSRGDPFLTLDASGPGGGPAGPIWNTAVVSEAAPSYAPFGGHLIQATTLLDRLDGLAGAVDVPRDLERLYQVSTRDWEASRGALTAGDNAGRMIAGLLKP